MSSIAVAIGSAVVGAVGGTGAAILGAGALGAGAALISGNQQSSAIESAASTSAAGTNAAIEMQLGFLRETRADIADAVEKGLVDLDEGFNAAIAALSPQYDVLAEHVNMLKSPNQTVGMEGGEFGRRGRFSGRRGRFSGDVAPSGPEQLLLAAPSEQTGAAPPNQSYTTPSGQPYNALAEYLNLLKNPDQIMNNPGVQFQYQQGIDALQTGFSRTSGGGLSGNIVAAAQQYGQNFASTALDAELARLGPLIGAQTNVSNLLAQQGTSKANLRLGGATGTANVGASIIPSVASGMSAGANTSAQAIMAQGNVAAGITGGISSSISDMASLYALRPDLFSSLTP